MIETFNTKLAGHVQIDALEVKANTAEEIRGLQSAITTYVEIPTTDNPMALVVAINRQTSCEDPHRGHDRERDSGCRGDRTLPARLRLSFRCPSRQQPDCITRFAPCSR